MVYLSRMYRSLQEYIIAAMAFINNVVLPFLFALALLFFLFNVVRYFVIGSSDQGARESARQLALYGIAGFVFLVSLWGIVNLFVNGLGWYGNGSVTPDYMQDSGYYDSDSSYADPFVGPR